MKKTLTKTEEAALTNIVKFGGYVTKDILRLWRRDVAADACYRTLKSLADKNFLVERPYYQNAATKKARIYQVTLRALQACGRGNAYMRHKHKPQGVHWRLMRSHFLFSLAGMGMDVPCCSVKEREEFLLSLGYPPQSLPTKRNVSKAGEAATAIQVEEHLLPEGAYAEKGGLCFLVVCRPFEGIAAQLDQALDRYARMAALRLAPIRLHFVTEWEHEAAAVLAIHEKKNGGRATRCGVSASFLSKSYAP